jgi:hypothetical protein
MNKETPTVLETPYIKISISNNGSYQILDKQAQVIWHSNPYMARFGSAAFRIEKIPRNHSLDNFEMSTDNGEVRMKYRSPIDKAELTINMKLLDDGKTLDLSYEPKEGLEIENIRILDDGFCITNNEKGYVVVPVREGAIIPSNSNLAFIRRFGTFDYEGCHMEMLGIVKDNSAVLVTWHNPNVTAEVKSTISTADVKAKQVLSVSLDLTRTARSIRIHFLGEGNYTTIAKAYREIAKEKGWLVTWKEKLRKTPEDVKLFGASNFTFWHLLERRLDYKLNEKFVTINWTFQEVAEIAEHLRNDLGIERALLRIGGWIYKGYDNYHPDILPANQECGGNEKLAEASRRIKKLGYFFSLHDNYQLMTENSPSYNVDYITKTPDGRTVSNGFWAGGPTWLICSKKYMDLAKRNLPEVKRLFAPNAYFVDQTTADNLQECFDPNHPLTKEEDMHYKQSICDYAKSIFGIFGSECGREWAIPHCDFFEGLSGVSGRYYHSYNLNPDELGLKVIPLFEMVYRDCIAIYGKYDYDYAKAAEYVIHHILMGRPLNYHTWEKGLYWKRASKEEPSGWPYDISCFIRADNGWAEGMCLIDRFIKNTHEVLSPLHEITACMTVTKHEFSTSHFGVEHVVFGEDMDIVANKASGEYSGTRRYRDYVHNSKMGGKVILPPYGFVIESPTFVAFHALTWDGAEYNKPVLFTIRSLDGKPINDSNKIRVFHGFGEQKLKLKGQILTVAKEEIFKFR